MMYEKQTLCLLPGLGFECTQMEVKNGGVKHTPLRVWYMGTDYIFAHIEFVMLVLLSARNCV